MNRAASNHTATCPSAQLNARVRGAFMLIGEHLSDWSRKNGYHRQNVYDALVGKWDGPRAREIRAEVVAYLASKGITL